MCDIFSFFEFNVRIDLIYKTTRVTTRDNTRQHEYNTTQHKYDTTQYKATRLQHEYNTTNTSTTRPNRSTKEKIGLHFALFVTELYIFLISFRNS